jgi:hypothetical protein
MHIFNIQTKIKQKGEVSQINYITLYNKLKYQVSIWYVNYTCISRDSW